MHSYFLLITSYLCRSPHGRGNRQQGTGDVAVGGGAFDAPHARIDRLARSVVGAAPYGVIARKNRLTNERKTLIICASNALRKRDRRRNGSERGRVRAPAFLNRSATSERPARSGTVAPVTEQRDQIRVVPRHFAPIAGVGCFFISRTEKTADKRCLSLHPITEVILCQPITA